MTLVGPRHRADLVLPSDEPLGTLLPEIIAVLGMGPGGQPRGYQLSMLGGRVLKPTANLRGAGVTDGAQLWVDPLTEAPSAAIVHDVSDEVADDLGRRRARWGDESRRWTATATVAAAALLAALLAGPQLPVVVLAVAGGVLLVAGTAVARRHCAGGRGAARGGHRAAHHRPGVDGVRAGTGRARRAGSRW